MDSSQRYIGAPSGVVLCVDRTNGSGLAGRFYHFYSETATEFQSMDELMFELEAFFDAINFPYPATSRRVFNSYEKKRKKSQENGNTQRDGKNHGGETFRGSVMVSNSSRNQERIKVMGEEELLRRHGDLGTFIVRVQQRQNSSWQGRITWSDRNETVNFRSAWEMVRLIADALDMVGGQPETCWPQEEEPEIEQ